MINFDNWHYGESDRPSLKHQGLWDGQKYWVPTNSTHANLSTIQWASECWNWILEQWKEVIQRSCIALCSMNGQAHVCYLHRDVIGPGCTVRRRQANRILNGLELFSQHLEGQQYIWKVAVMFWPISNYWVSVDSTQVNTCIFLSSKS